MNKVQAILIPIFILSALVAVLIFAGVLPGLRETRFSESDKVKFWSTLSQQETEAIIGEFRRIKPGLNLSYQEKDKKDYYEKLVEELASFSGPDVFTISQDRILKFKDKIFPIPFDAFSQRKFKDLFIEEGKIFISKEGILAFPIMVDPMVLYWNQDLFRNEGLSRPPATWDEFLRFSEKLTKFDEAGNILQSGTALGEFSNIVHAKDILSLLILQSGNKIVDEQTLKVVISDYLPEETVRGAEGAIRFFNEFKDSRKKTYSWNRNFPSDKEAFLQNKLGMYFGYASEYQEIKNKAPFLNFDVALVPQVRGAKIKATYGNIISLAVSKISQNKKLGFDFINYLLTEEAGGLLQEKFFLPSALNSLLISEAKDPAFEIFRLSAILTRVWLDPDPEKTNAIFKEMTESASSGRKRIDQAVDDAAEKLKELMKIYTQPEL